MTSITDINRQEEERGKTKHTDCRRCSFIFCFLLCLLDEYSARDKRRTNQLFLSQGPGAVVKSGDIWAFQTTSANSYAFHCAEAAGPVSKAAKRPCQFREDDSTKTPFFSVVTGIMLFHWCPAKTRWQFDIVMVSMASITDAYMGAIKTTQVQTKLLSHLIDGQTNIEIKF